MLCHDQPVQDFGPMQSVPDFGPMQLVPDFGLMQWARPSMCFICIVWYVVVWGSSLSFVLTVLVLVSGTSASRGKSSGWWHRTHHSFSFCPGSWFSFLDMFWYSCDTVFLLQYFSVVFEKCNAWFYYDILSFMIFGYIKNEIFGSYFWVVSVNSFWNIKIKRLC